MKKFSSITRVNSRHISQTKRIKRILLVGVIALIVVLLIPKFVASVASVVLTPVHSIQSWFAISADSFPQFIRERSILVDELNTFKSQQSAQSGDRYTIQLLSAENFELRSLLGDEDEHRIVAGVIGRPNKLPYDVLVLDKGSRDGVVEGAPVFIGNDAVIGIVNKVFLKSAVVELATTPGFVSSVYILGPNIYSTAEGVGGGQMRVGVPQGIQLTVGDVVILPGVGSGIYGAINTINSIPTQPEQYAFVSPEVPLAGLRLVSVGDSPLEPLSFEDAQRLVAESKQAVFSVPVPDHMLITTESTTTASSTAASSTTETP